MVSILNDEFIPTIITEEEAWKELSSSSEWNETLLEKYQDQVDWEKIPTNGEITWTIPMIRKFMNKLNWTKFSGKMDEYVLTPEVIEAFKNKWDWHILSANPYVPFSYEFLEKYADLLDWGVFIKNWRVDFYRDKGIDLYNQFKEYIPACKLKGSNLWYEMVNQQVEMITRDIIA